LSHVGAVSWSAALLALLVSHVVGDVLFQTDSQARTKVGGLGEPASRLALRNHVLSYTVAFVPAIVWIADHQGAIRALAVGALVAVTHLLVDDGRLVRTWLRNVKHAQTPAVGLAIAVDQSFHLLCLLAAALIAAG
jgi:hypothetical protein